MEKAYWKQYAFFMGVNGMKSRRQVSIFRTYVMSRKLRYTFGFALLAVSLAFQLYIPIVLKELTDGLQGMSISGGQVLVYALGIIGLGLMTAVFLSISRIWLFQLARRLEQSIRARLFAHWERLSAAYYNKQRIGDLMAHAVSDVNLVRELAMGGLFQLVEAVLLISIAIAVMATSVHLGLTFVVALPLPLLAVLAYIFSARIQRQSLGVQEAFSTLTSRAQQFCAGVRVIMANSQEREERGEFDAVNELNRGRNLRMSRSNALFTSLSMGLVGISYLLSVIFGGLLVLRGTITLGEFVAFNTYLLFLMQPVENLGKVINVFQRAMVADVRLRRILRTEPEVKDAPGTVSVGKLSGAISISGLTFAYPDSERSVLRDIELEVPAGRSLAIVGKVGCGKTTLINLLLRIYNPPPGTVRLDGHDILHIPLKDLRDAIGYVPQDYFLFSSTIGDNIAFDPKPYAEEHIHEAARQAQVYDNIAELPDQFATRLGERGISLSGGQRQRISIARALIKNPRLLIFDDSLSAVDAETEERILHNMREASKGRTTLIVSHRISTIQHADQIVVMDEGRIVERGSHRELLQLGGMYAQMALRQSMNRDIERVEADMGGRTTHGHPSGYAGEKL